MRIARQTWVLLALPDLGGLYWEIETYIDRHRHALLRGAADAGVFFVKTMKAKSKDPAYDQNTFHEAWRLAIQRPGSTTFIPAAASLRACRPMAPTTFARAAPLTQADRLLRAGQLRDQDTPDTIAEHYGRFLSQDKATLAAQDLNLV